MSKVFVVDTNYTPLDPIHPGYARHLLTHGQAAVYRRFPFTVILKRAVEEPVTQPLRLKLDPGSQMTGIAIVNDTSGEVVWAAELQHQGQDIKVRLERRHRARHSRRQRKTRYRQPRFKNRHRRKGLLPPSLESRIVNILTWVRRCRRVCPITAISQELVKFDTQAMQDAEVSGVEYQQGELQGYEVREYLLEKYQRTCAYCGKKNVPLQLEHLVARANGGSNRVSNLTIACEKCNQKKGKQDIRIFLKDKPDTLKRVLAQAKIPLKDAAAINMTRWKLYDRLKATGLPVEWGTGGMTKFHRTTQGLAKHHWIDAACVGASTPQALLLDQVRPLLITAEGHGNRQMCSIDKHGFPRSGPKQAKKVYGFQTGDIVKAVITRGKKAGNTYVGRVTIRVTGYFDITIPTGKIGGIPYHSCTILHHTDGYSYQKGVCVKMHSMKT